MTSAIIVRDAGEADRSALNALTHASSSHHGVYGAMLDGYEISAAQMQRDVFRVAARDDAILGYYSLIVEGEPELDLMFVADSAQGLGLGALLMRDMLATARQRAIASVKIVSHPPSAGFYERMGATVVGVHPPSGRVTWSRPVLTISTRP